jgi:hypothetical protein
MITIFDLLFSIKNFVNNKFSGTNKKGSKRTRIPRSLWYGHLPVTPPHDILQEVKGYRIRLTLTGREGASTIAVFVSPKTDFRSDGDQMENRAILKYELKKPLKGYYTPLRGFT